MSRKCGHFAPTVHQDEIIAGNLPAWANRDGSEKSSVPRQSGREMRSTFLTSFQMYCLWSICERQDLSRFPHLVHDADHLQRQHVLAQVVPRLEDDVDGRALRVRVLEHQPQRQLLRVHELALFYDQTRDFEPAKVDGVSMFLQVTSPRLFLWPEVSANKEKRRRPNVISHSGSFFGSINLHFSTIRPETSSFGSRGSMNLSGKRIYASISRLSAITRCPDTQRLPIQVVGLKQTLTSPTLDPAAA